MNEIKKIELIADIESDHKSALFDHIQENEKDFKEVRLSISELDKNLQNIQLIPGDKGERGLQGERGLDGRDGVDGKDGYTPIKGIDYFDGKDGIDGLNGLVGKTGEPGEKGEKGDKPKHRWKGSKLQFEKPDGTWGQLIELKPAEAQILPQIGSLGASYPQVRQNNALKTTGAREFDFRGDGVEVGVEGTKAIITIAAGGSGADDQTASEVPTSTTNFNNNLSSADNDVQKALDTIDNINIISEELVIAYSIAL